MHKDKNAAKSYNFLSPPNKKATMYYIKHYVVWKIKYRWAIYKLTVT